jgi:UDP-GlcNAc:undecaprenyl-phosphate/decaprenyl-phosphate GlcNAc-1-phosphate transferase
MFLTLCFCSLIFSYLLTGKILTLAQKFNIVDDPALSPSRKKQAQPIPLLGGLGFSVVAGVMSIGLILARDQNWLGLTSRLYQNIALDFNFWGILAGGIVILVAGFLDDKFDLDSRLMLILVNLAILIAVFAGDLNIVSLSYPFNQLLPNFDLLHSLLAYVWILICVSATKFLDGHDGLVGSIGVFALITIAVVSLFPNVNQPLIFVLAAIWASAILGFLPFNLPNARIYLGEIGSEMIGFVIGVLSILSGAKVATTSSIIGWFILDLILVFAIRLSRGKSILTGGREHWPFRLMDKGLTKWQVLLLTLAVIITTSVLGLLLPTLYKPLVLLLQAVILVLGYRWTSAK